MQDINMESLTGIEGGLFIGPILLFIVLISQEEGVEEGIEFGGGGFGGGGAGGDW